MEKKKCAAIGRRKDWFYMKNEQKYKLLENRLNKLLNRHKDNQGACRKIRRKMRHLETAA